MNQSMSSICACMLAAAVCMTAACNDDPYVRPDIPDPAKTTETVGQPLSAWTEGMLDIHFINTTTGECTFIIFPDGTQMLVDAAGSTAETGPVGSTTNVGIRSRWDPTKTAGWNPGKYIADYIRKCMQWTQNNTLDYVVATHFHADHIGGMADVLDELPAKKMLDRGWPDYDYPFDMRTKASNATLVTNYVNAVKSHVASSGLTVEMFKAGSDDQIKMLRKASDYPGFSVRNIAVNGEIWTGNGNTTTATFPALKDIKVANPKSVANEDNCPEENHCTTVFKISYGKFDFFHAGDAQYDGCSSFAWKDMETPVAIACGAVDVMKADHHGVTNTNGYGYKAKNGHICEAMKYLNPRCWIVNSWTDGHPRQKTYEGVTALLTSMNIFITNTCSDMQSYANFQNVKGSDGHIVVHVSTGGDKYFIYTLTDSDGKGLVKQISGPYSSR